MSTASRWLNWKPSQHQKIDTRVKPEPTKSSFEGFVGSSQRENRIIRRPETFPSECPYPLPKGIKLIRYVPKNRPVAVTVCSVVTDVPKFIQHAIRELDARLHSPVQIRAVDSVFDLLSKLADCGVELRLVWPPETQITNNAPQPQPSKPTKPQESNADDLEITDEDIPF